MGYAQGFKRLIQLRNGLCACQEAINLQTLEHSNSMHIEAPGSAKHRPDLLMLMGCDSQTIWAQYISKSWARQALQMAQSNNQRPS